MEFLDSMCVCSERKSYLKVNLSKKQISLSKISCDIQVEVLLSFFFSFSLFFSYLWNNGGGFQSEIKGDVRFDNCIVQHVSWWFFTYRLVNGNCVLAQQKGMSFFKCLFTFREQNVMHISS